MAGLVPAIQMRERTGVRTASPSASLDPRDEPGDDERRGEGWTLAGALEWIPGTSPGMTS